MEAFASSASPLERPIDIDLTMPESSRPNSSDMKMPNNPNIGSSADKPIELDLDSMDIDMADLFGDSVDNTSTGASNAVDGLFSPVVRDTVMTNDFHEKSTKTDGGFLDALNQPSNDIFASLDHSDRPQQLKASPSVAQSAPYQGSLLSSLSSSSQLVANAPTPNDASGELQFDLNSLDLSNLSPEFFTNADMNFPMDMNDFLNLRGMHEQKGDYEGTRLDAA
jgi:hypothetical protein